MQVVIKVSEEAARSLRGQERLPAGERLRALANRLGLHLEPMHPGTFDRSMQQYFTLEAGDQAAAMRAVKVLQQEPFVEAAYVKPADEAP